MRNIASFVLFVHGKHARTTPPTVSSRGNGGNVGVGRRTGQGTKGNRLLYPVLCTCDQLCVSINLNAVRMSE